MTDLTQFNDAPPPHGASPFVSGKGPGPLLAIVAYDAAWPRAFAVYAARVRAALGDDALAIEHIGSTAVPGLPAKPVIDVDLTVGDSALENAYLPALESAGFELTVREPWWLEHRGLRLCDSAGVPLCHLHVFSPGAAELRRHLIFRDWLRAHPDDAARYRDAKLAAYAASLASGGHMLDYNARKQEVIREIYARAFASLGL